MQLKNIHMKIRLHWKSDNDKNAVSPVVISSPVRWILEEETTTTTTHTHFEWRAPKSGFVFVQIVSRFIYCIFSFLLLFIVNVFVAYLNFYLHIDSYHVSQAEEKQYIHIWLGNTFEQWITKPYELTTIVFVYCMSVSFSFDLTTDVNLNRQKYFFFVGTNLLTGLISHTQFTALFLFICSVSVWILCFSFLWFEGCSVRHWSTNLVSA